ncbi:MAG: type IV toxin-antitoxin system AbiEi family antitoxin domain-containing protein [Polyangiaceae bacterium]|nr:type IV toxin-antitoxin system AbiEi family antitoxin domain-containing protein [Polyangiaceae bacterium]MBK8998517.1 type IV toxin-antitoxin system AbiEi family antitoxin domain-containing protein [Myxococcales bacterium]
MPTNRNASSHSGEPAGQAVFRPREVAKKGVSRTALGRLTRAGKLERVGRGLYVSAGAKVTEHHTLVEAAKRVPAGIVCLLSALAFHGMTTQSPHEVWVAIDVKARKPKTDWPPMRIVRFSGRARTFGVEEHVIEGVEVKVTSRAKTVADCFKYRNKIGIDVAVEALRDYLGKRGRSMDDLLRAAEVCRVSRVMKPYMESFS